MTGNIKKKKIIFFTEFSKKIGGGHYARSKRLYNILKKKYKCNFYFNKNKKKINDIIKFEYKYYKLLVIYDLKKIYNYNFYKKKEIFYICFDNIKKFNQINYININPLNFAKGKYNGPKYYPYPKDLLNVKIQKKAKRVKKILIIQGSTDAYNFRDQILKLTRNFLFIKKIQIYMPGKKNYKKNNIIYFKKFKNISSLLTKIDIAITSTGNLACEIGYLGIPMLYMTKDKIEKTRAKILTKKNIGKMLSIRNKRNVISELNKLIFDYKYRNYQIKQNLLYFRNDGLKNVLKIINKKYEKI